MLWCNVDGKFQWVDDNYKKDMVSDEEVVTEPIEDISDNLEDKPEIPEVKISKKRGKKGG